MMMEMFFEEDGFKNGGGLHYLVDFAETHEAGLFWGMALNFTTFGTVAPFDSSCYCNFPKMPPAYKKMKRQWDNAFARAKADIKDVQCMFTDSKEGCHLYGLPGELGCKFKHDTMTELKEEEEENNEEEKEEVREEEKVKDEDEENDADKSTVPRACRQRKKNKGRKKKNIF